MSKEIEIINLQGKKQEKVKTPFWLSIPANNQLLFQTVNYYQSLQNSASAHAKRRGEVSGGGKKPWKQKGTGRARTGSLRSPIFRGGGIIFGPNSDINPKKNIPKKIRQKAVFIGFSVKLKDKKLEIIQPLKLTKISTKTLAKIFEKESKSAKNILLFDQNPELKIAKSAQNIENFILKDIKSVNLLDILKHDLIVITKNAFDYLDQKAQQQITKNHEKDRVS